jgi:hypothetical protein
VSKLGEDRYIKGPTAVGVRYDVLLEGFLGSQAWMAARLGAEGSKSTNVVKGAAARANGCRGERRHEAVAS